ncbi:GNAT family N-acetyltransferase [Nocardiopsis sp. NPDC058631]|uniref:GNAT family N-acetyltransferase n=1 Tax=Nocardiopsis sp. NPDC058631 TaxID=3346566 RepID=UPI00364A4600
MNVQTRLRPRPATDDDVQALIDLRLAAASWLRSIGSDQWHNTARAINDIRSGVASGTTWVIDHDDQVAAILTLAGPDFDFWTQDDDPDNALYLYKFMIGDARRGTGLGDRFLDWAFGRAAARGKAWLRLDCWRTNPALHRYYLDRGFEHLRTDVFPGRGSGALFQRATAEPGAAGS